MSSIIFVLARSTFFRHTEERKLNFVIDWKIDMLYTFLVKIVNPFLNLINGRPKIYNRENIPEGNYIIIAPHRTWMDPVLLALAVWPKKFSFMAKKELFKNPIASKFLKALNAYPVDRKNPGPYPSRFYESPSHSCPDRADAFPARAYCRTRRTDS